MSTINLQAVPYLVKMLDGRPLSAEVHQAAPLINVDVTVGKTKEAIDRVDMMNKNIAAYVKFYFLVEGVSEGLIIALLKTPVGPGLINSFQAVLCVGQDLEKNN